MSLWTEVRQWGPRVGAGLVGVAVVATAMWWAAGIVGVAIALVVAALWPVVPTVYAVATGGLLFAILVGNGGSETLLAASSLLALFAVDLSLQWPARTAVLGVAVLVGTVGGLSAVLVFESLWVSGIALLAGFAVAAYALHRYELVRLGLLAEANR